MAPEDQKADLIAAAARHAVDTHGHEDTPQLRKDLEGFLETIDA
jgi:hypothetical protein